MRRDAVRRLHVVGTRGTTKTTGELVGEGGISGVGYGAACAGSIGNEVYEVSQARFRRERQDR